MFPDPSMLGPPLQACKHTFIISLSEPSVLFPPEIGKVNLGKQEIHSIGEGDVDQAADA